MSAPDLARFDELLSRYLDASLGDADEHELLGYLSDADLASRFHEATQLSTEIAGVLAGSVPDEVMISLVLSDLVPDNESAPGDLPTIPKAGSSAARAKRRYRTPFWLALAAMVVLLVGIVAIYLFPHAPVPVAPAPVAVAVQTPPPMAANVTVSSVRGEVYLVGTTGRESLAAGQTLKGGGTIQTVGQRSRATVVLRDGSEIELKGDTTFTVETGSAVRRLFLQQGMFIATVTKQRENDPMIFTTDRAVATVRGTRLAMVTDESGPYLIVADGTVALQRSSGGPEILIAAGFYCHVEGQGQFRPFPNDRLPRDLQERLPEK